MPGIDVKMMSYGERLPAQDRYNSEESLEDNQSTTSSTESRQSDFQKKEHEFIPTRSSGIMASKPASNPGQFTRINSNPLLISAQKQMLVVEEAKKKKKEEEKKEKIGEDIPDWQSNLDGWKLRRRKQSEDAIERLTEIKKFGEGEENQNGNRKSSLGKKFSLQYQNDDVIDFGDLDLNEDKSEEREMTASPERSPLSIGVSRRESRGISEEKVIPEMPEEEEEERENVEETREDRRSPYESAIESYRSFAKSKLAGSSNTGSDREDSGNGSDTQLQERNSSVSKSCSTSSMSSSFAPPHSKSRSPPDTRNDDAWEEKIETFVQPARRVSSEISEKMKLKLASFEDSKSGKEQTPVRLIEPDNSFKDKLKAFKTIEKSSEPSLPAKPTRRESEPCLQNTKQKSALGYRSTSSSFMNTFQNNKFFQQNSLGSDKDDESQSLSSNHQLLDDALEESFNVLEDSREEAKVFSADDFIPLVGKLAPPQEKPPPLPSNPPPDVLDQQKFQTETEIDKQEREIIESLEREEKEHKKYLSSASPSGPGQTQTDPVTSPVRSWPAPAAQTNNQKGEHPRKREKSEVKDYNKHWLIQEAEQRRISEAKQKQNLPATSTNSTNHQGQIDKIENLNNNHHAFGEKRVHHAISDNIYANVDPSNISHSINPSGPHVPEPGLAAGIPQIPGPQVPPRLGDPRQDRVLSVSGKKKCSHCKDELGRGAAMIIESLRLFYHIRCFKCCVCSIQLGNGETGTDVRVRNNRLHCQNCYSNDEGLKFSKV